MVDLADLRALVREVNFSTHGVEATVTVPDGSPVSTRIIWLTPVTEQVPTGGQDFKRSEAKRILAIRRDDVPVLPRGTLVAVAEHLLVSPAEWKVDGMEAVYSDHFRVTVVANEQLS